MAKPKTEPNVMGFGYTAEGEWYLLIGIREAPPRREKPGCLARGVGMALVVLTLLMLLTSCKEYVYLLEIDGETYTCKHYYRSVGDCGISFRMSNCMGYADQLLVRNVQDYFKVEKILVSE